MGRCRSDVPWFDLLAFDKELLDRKLKKDREDNLESLALNGDLGGCFESSSRELLGCGCGR